MTSQDQQTHVIDHTLVKQGEQHVKYSNFYTTPVVSENTYHMVRILTLCGYNNGL